jgi:hypothetical protein
MSLIIIPFKEVYDSWYTTNMRLEGQPLTTEEMIKEAHYILFASKDIGECREIRFERNPELINKRQKYIGSFILEKNNTPPTTGFDLKAWSGKIGTLGIAIDKIVNETPIPDTIRILRSPEKDLYAIFVGTHNIYK